MSRLFNAQLPAHPVANSADWFAGITKREYFAAHAPPAPEWFKPRGLPAKPVIPDLPPDISQEERNKWWEIESDDPADYAEWPRLAVFARLHRQAIEDRDAWYTKSNIATEVQWRWAYADAVLAGQDAQS